MAVTSDPTDPQSLTPEPRLAELAAILATGVRRVFALRAGAADMPAIQRFSVLPPESTCFVPQTSVTAPRG